MMKKRAGLGIFFILLGVGMFSTYLLSADVPRMAKEELKGLLGNPDLAIVDVRSDEDWKSSEMKIKGAVREEPNETESWAVKYSKDKVLVLYCA